ncbi:MAG: aminotransferase class V-fold PLP-dependent enzyme [Gaiellaceae bacterium]
MSVGAEIRPRFPIFEHTTYANSCSQGALSVDVREAYEDYLAGWDERGSEWEHWVERAETARAAFARLVGAGPEEIAVTTSVSQAVSALVSALPLERERNRIVISEFEFPTVGQISHAQELRGAEVVHVPPEPDGRIPLERFAEAIDDRTALVCCTAISYRTGYRLDVAEVARLAHEQGALCLADSYQAAGAIPLDVGGLGVDLLTAGTVKYLLGSSGLAFMYVTRELHELLLPTQTGWFADEDIFEMDISDYSPASTARRFDAGTPPVPNIFAGLAGMGIVERAGVGAIESHVRGLVDRLLAGLDEIGASVATPRGDRERGPLVCVTSTDAHALVDALARERIVTSERDSNLRISLHLYNVEEDVDRILDALRGRRELLGPPWS